MALPKVSLRGLLAFLAVYEEQSFSRAAARENATQSGMSTQVKNLETALGTPVLQRGRGNLALTPAGAIVYERGRVILRDLFALEAQVDRLRGRPAGNLHFGIIPTLTRAVLPRALRRFRTGHPDVELTVIEEYSYSLMRRVVEGTLDCAAVPAGDILKGLVATPLGTDSEVLAAPPDFRPDLPHLAPVTPRDLVGLNLVLPSDINVRRRGLEQFFSSHGVTPGARMDMDAMLGTLELIGAGHWCAILPAALCAPDVEGGARKLHPLTEPELRLDYVVVQKAERAMEPAGEVLVTALREAAGEIRQEWDEAVAGTAGC